MAFVDLLAAICIFVNCAKGISALQLSRDLDCQYKTAFVLAHKLREAMAKGNDGVTLDGTVEIDGAYFGGHVRPENRKEDRKDRRLAANRDADRRVVVVLRQRSGRTLPFVVKREAEGAAIVRERVALGSELHADEGPHWDELEALYHAHRINHSEAFSWDGACTNQAESYFSRLRRAVDGQHHHVSQPVPLSVRERGRVARGSPPGGQRRAARGRAGVGAGLAGQPGLEGVLAAGGLARLVLTCQVWPSGQLLAQCLKSPLSHTGHRRPSSETTNGCPSALCHHSPVRARSRPSIGVHPCPEGTSPNRGAAVGAGQSLTLVEAGYVFLRPGPRYVPGFGAFQNVPHIPQRLHLYLPAQLQRKTPR